MSDDARDNAERTDEALPTDGDPTDGRSSAASDGNDTDTLDPDTLDFPVVGIGASAGGLGAFRTFLEALPDEPGMAFVLVQHLDPNRESDLAGLLQSSTGMRVVQVEEGGGMALDADTVYVIPPARNLVIDGGKLHLSEMESARAERAPIDHFFRSLAEGQDGNAVGVVLSGSGSGGTTGLKRIKERGGITLVQDPAEAEFEGMPRSAVRMGMVDVTAPIAELAEQLVQYRDTRSRIELPSDGEDLPDGEEKALSKVFAQLHARTGHDFSHYKRSTMLRRIGRRMQVNRIEKLPGYLAYLREHEEEAQALFKDLLITVTNFFRDLEAFETLRTEIVPKLFEGKDTGDTVRVWASGCATGEEAYSLAILLHEHAATLEGGLPEIQIFATDLGEEAVGTAREGFYPEDIAADLSEERLERFFEKESDGYRVQRPLRESVIFAKHDLMSDPPFSRLDLVACRNLLIYLKREMQKRVFDVFHYALRPGGYLFLGTAESAEEAGDLFRPIHKKHRLYRRREDAPHTPRLEEMPFLRQGRADPQPAAETPSTGRDGSRFEDVRVQLLEEYAPPGVMVNEQHDIVHVFKGADRYLRVAPGAPTQDVMETIRPELRTALRTALFQAKDEEAEVKSRAVSFEEEAGPRRRVRLVVRPVEDSGFLLVRFERADDEETDDSAPADETAPPPEAEEISDEERVAEDGDALVEQLETELKGVRRELRGTVEEYETSVEELRASNEELQSMNEELRSTTEELETSKEELQSMNEELTTVNQELDNKNEELSRLNSDLQNLLRSTEIATIFLDRDLRVQRFTPRVTDVYNIIESDRGRPLEHLTRKFTYEGLLDDAERVLERLVPIEQEVRNEDGQWFLVRLRPYRTAHEDKIEGVVITFVDITERRRAREALRSAKEYIEKIIDTVREPLLVLTPELRVQSANRSFYQTFRARPPATEGTLIYELGDGQWDIPELRELLEDVLSEHEAFDDYLVEHDFEEIGRRVMLLNARRVQEEDLILLAMEDVTEYRTAQRGQRRSEREYTLVVENVEDYAIFTLDPGGNVRTWNPGAQDIFGWSEEEIKEASVNVLFTEEDRRAGAYEREVETARAEGRAADRRWHLRKDGSRFWADGILTRLDDEEGHLRGFTKIVRDATDRKRYEEGLVEAKEKAEEMARMKSSFLANMGHEVRTPLTSMIGLAEMLEGELEDQQQEHAGLIWRSGQRLLETLNAILSLSRLEAGRAAPTLEAFDAAEEIRETVEMHRLDAEAKGLELRFETPAEGVSATLDQNFLRRIAGNLLSNAIKFTREGRVRVALTSRENSLRLTVSDTGDGIGEDFLADLYEEFRQESTGVGRTHEGSGLGLAITKQLVELMDGCIGVESEPGAGTTFTVELPLDGEAAERVEKGTISS